MTRDDGKRISTQVLVIGSGAGGAIAAATLAEAGLSVVIAEEGSEIDTSAMETHTPEAMRLLYRNGGLSPILGRSNIAFVEGCCVGGSTEINSAFWQRTPEVVLDAWRRSHGVADLSPEALASLFDEIEPVLHVSSLKSAAVPESSAVFRSGAEKLGWRLEEIPRAQKVDLASSQFSAGAKQSASRTYLPRARAAGARLLSGCRVERLHYRDGRVSHAVAIVSGPQGSRELEIEADNVFVCAGAIQTPALLRRSGIKGNVGNSLRIHPMLKIAALFDHRLDSHRSALPIYQVKEFWPELTLGGSVFTPGFLAVTLSDNWAENQSVLKDWRNMGLYYAACRSSRRGTVRVFPLTGEAVVRYDLSEEDCARLSRGLALLGEALFAGGAVALYPALRSPPRITSVAQCREYLKGTLPAARMNLSTVHAFSSCPMGENRRLCAVDSYGKVFDFANLYLADASVLPDSPGINPQGTIMALALRAARRFLAGSR